MPMGYYSGSELSKSCYRKPYNSNKDVDIGQGPLSTRHRIGSFTRCRKKKPPHYCVRRYENKQETEKAKLTACLPLPYCDSLIEVLTAI